MRWVTLTSLIVLLSISQTTSECVPDPCDSCNSEQTCTNGVCTTGGVVPPVPEVTPKPEVTATTTTVTSEPEVTTTPEVTSGPVVTPSESPVLPTLNPIHKIITADDWNTLFPGRWYQSQAWKNEYTPYQPWYYPEMAIDYYSYNVFLKSVERIAKAGYPNFANEPGTTEEERKRELCAFLGNVKHETGRGTDGLAYREELQFERTTSAIAGGYRDVGSRTTYRMGTTPIMFRPGTALAGQTRFTSASYHGRGPLQLSWGYNYGDYSKSVFGDPQVLLENPDRILDEPELGLGAALWFWMTQPDYNMARNPHKVIYKTSQLQPWGFGRTIMAINGGLEQGGTENGASSVDQKVTRRISGYRACAKHFGISVGGDGEQLDTRGLTPYN